MQKTSVLKCERLIGNVRATKALYDPSQDDYGVLSAKNLLWQKVAAKSGINTANEAKRMWKNLRDTYRIYRVKMHLNPKKKMWKFYNHMNFLEPYIKERKFHKRSKSAVMEDLHEASNDSTVLDGSLHINETEGNFTTIQYWNDAETTSSTKETGDEIKQDEDIFVPPSSIVTRPEIICDSDTESLDHVLPVELNNIKDDSSSLKMFFDAMYASTKQLPHKLQRSVQNKLFTAVMQAEEEAENLEALSSKTVQIKHEIPI